MNDDLANLAIALLNLSNVVVLSFQVRRYAMSRWRRAVTWGFIVACAAVGIVLLSTLALGRP